ncbi:DUF3426 domain-containing protein [Marinimicrobium sp. C2-29]|uniref:DUF3426 domain-containing protein n=1 Tax=Marinimicrobium sp. C2-29 TaxID=3139825 RepID=UPI0031387013
MTSTQMVTRCPQCGTSFRITPAQLQSARGAVRCGACLHIFKARDHLVGAASEAETSSALVRKPNGDTARSATPTRPSTKTTAGARPPAAGPKATPRQPNTETGKPASQSERKPARAPSESRSSTTKPETKERQLSFDQERIDEEWSQLDDDDFLISDDMGESRTSEEEDPFGIGKQSRASSHSLFERAPKPESEQDQEPTDDTDESWAMSLLEEEEESSSADVSLSKPSGEPSRPSFELVEEPTDAELEQASRDSEHMNFHMEPSDSTEESGYRGEHLRARDPERSALLMNIDPEPVEMTWTRQHHRQQRRKWLWGGLALVALLLILVQVAWLQFDRLSRIEPYRSVYATACGVLGCTLPTLEDRSRIRAYNLVVRNHPDRENALVVDAILLNNAGFAQSFPDLILEFSDLNGEAVAARRFSPDEYLSGELAGRESMPPNQPVHLTLELVDPGEEAVNYRAYIPD